jgi:hypothetical protein
VILIVSAIVPRYREHEMTVEERKLTGIVVPGLVDPAVEKGAPRVRFDQGVGSPEGRNRSGEDQRGGQERDDERHGCEWFLVQDDTELRVCEIRRSR